MNKKVILKLIAVTLFTVSILLNIYLFSQFKIKKPVNNNQSNNNIESKQATPVEPIPDTQLAENLIAKTCTESDSNVYTTECVVELLDRTAAEREWKQRKLETAKHPQINTYNLLGDLHEGQLAISNWRKNFETTRDSWCNARFVFKLGSGIPLDIATCQLEFEIVAINDLNNIYYQTIMKDTDYSEGIPNFEPTSKDIDALSKTNATTRGCIWAGETNCK